MGYAATPAASQANFEFILAATFRRRASNKRSKTSIKRTQPRLARWRQKATPISNRPRVAGSLASLARLRRDQGHRAEARDHRGASFSLIVLLLAVARRNSARRRLSAGRKWIRSLSGIVAEPRNRCRRRNGRSSTAGPMVRIHFPPADSLVSRRNSPVTVEKPRFSASVAGRSSQRGRQRRA